MKELHNRLEIMLNSLRQNNYLIEPAKEEEGNKEDEEENKEEEDNKEEDNKEEEKSISEQESSSSDEDMVDSSGDASLVFYNEDSINNLDELPFN